MVCVPVTDTALPDCDDWHRCVDLSVYLYLSVMNNIGVIFHTGVLAVPESYYEHRRTAQAVDEEADSL